MGIFQQFPYSNFHEFNLDQIIKIMKEMQTEWENTKTEWASYKDFIDNYFANLDLDEETEKALRTLLAEGALDPVIDPIISAAVATWLTDHITQPTTPAIDTSLTVAGAAADAKATGDADAVLLADIEAGYDAHNALLNNMPVIAVLWETGNIKPDGSDLANNQFKRSHYIDIENTPVDAVYLPVADTVYLYQYDSNNDFITGSRIRIDHVGKTVLSLNANTKYIRLTTLKVIALDILAPEKIASIHSLNNVICIARNTINKSSPKCVHHDNFSRLMDGYNIGKNSEGSLTENSYNLITGANDDGVRVNYGLTITADSTRTDPFTLREIAAEHADNFMVEISAPENGKSLYVAFNVQDGKNFEAISISYNGTYYSVSHVFVKNGSFVRTETQHFYNTLGYVVQFFFIANVLTIVIDEKYLGEFIIDGVSDHVSIGNYKSGTTELKFINVFDLITPLVYDTEFLTDNNVSALPNSVLSANPGRYSLVGTPTRFSNKSEMFALDSSDPLIFNGKRTERSLAALLPHNLRTMHYEFDVYFPSSVGPDTATESYADIFFQLHDRQDGVSRGAVPFFLALVGDEIWLSQHASAEQASPTLDTITSSFVCGEVTYDKWMHFDLFIKERYEENQHPFLELKINDDVVYQSRKPNCANDVNGSSAQYGEYKNTWDVITYSERYVDNFKVTY